MCLQQGVEGATETISPLRQKTTRSNRKDMQGED